MQDLTQMITSAELTRLREAFDPEVLLRANSGAFATVYPRLASWGENVGELFFAPGPLAPRERELCLVTLLTQRSPGLSLGNHVYWALMEGVTVEQICQAVGLAGCYGGLPTYTQGVFTVHRTLTVLKKLAPASERGPETVLRALVEAFAGLSL